MIAEVSQGFSVPASGLEGPRRTTYTWHRVPNLRDEVTRDIGRSRAGFTWHVICTQMAYAVHKGRTTWEQQRLGIGLRRIAEISGQHPAKVRRDVAALANLGLITVMRPNVVTTLDRETGRFKTKIIGKGRAANTVIIVTLTEDHLRPSKGQGQADGATIAANPGWVDGATKDGSAARPSPDACKARGATTFIDPIEINKEQPVGLADGIGSPPAGEGRLAAAEAGRQSPAKASQEGRILPEAAGRDEPPTSGLMPAMASDRPRRAPTAAPVTPIPKERRRSNKWQENPAPAQGWSGAAEAARLRMLRDMDAERRRQAEADELFRQRHAKGHAGNTNLR